MSRHRNVRSLNYAEEYEGYDDVYGHSVEDDYCISPSVSQYMFDRTSGPQMSSFLAGESRIAEVSEEDSDPETIGATQRTRNDSTTFRTPPLSHLDEAKLQSCLDEIHNVVGDSVPEPVLVKAILGHQFNLEKALNAVLISSQGGAKQPVADEPKLDKRDRDSKSRPAVVTPDGPLEGRREVVKTDIPEEVKEPPVPPVDDSAIKVVPVTAHATSVVRGFDVTEEKDRSESADEADKKTEAKMKDSLSIYLKSRSETKDLINLVVIGHVDAGKSTLMGHLLYQVGEVNKKTMHKYEQESKKVGKQSFVFAWVLDETGEERSRGITMDVGRSKFETPTKTVTLLDAPGHKDFIPNMITGAAQADVAVLVVDATRGEFETGFESGGQTREHALLVRSLGVSQLAAAVNKLDTVNWSQERFQEIQKKLGLFLKQAGFRDVNVTFVPCSGLTGENLTQPPTEPLLKSWYSGPTLLDVIDGFQTPDRPVTRPFRLTISDIFKSTGSGFCVAGKVETGLVHTGEKTLVQPQGEIAQVKGILSDELPVNIAFAGDHVTVTLAGIDMQNVSIGYVLCDPVRPIRATMRLQARVVVFNIEVPITKGFPVVLHFQSLAEQATVKKLISTLHKSTGEVVKQKPRCLTKNSNALIELETGRPICVELYREVKELGRFMLRSGGTTIAAGMVTEIY